MTNLLIIDKDQTLVRSRLGGNNFIQRPWDQVPISGIFQKLDRYYQEDWKIVIASNQAGIDCGYKSLEAAFFEMEFCFDLFPMIDEAFFCPDWAGEQCWKIWRNEEMKDNTILYDRNHFDSLDLAGFFRKPNPGMLKLAIYLHSPDNCFYVGDRPEDEQAAIAANLKFIWAEDFVNL